MGIGCINPVDLFENSPILDDPHHAVHLKVEPILSNVEIRIVPIEKDDSSVFYHFSALWVEKLPVSTDRCELHATEELFHQIIEKIQR